MKKTGRPRVTSERTDNLIKRIVTKQPTTSSTQISSELPLTSSVSCRTIRRRLHDELDLKSYRPAPKPLLSAKNIRDRVSFAKKYRHFTFGDWGRVLFSDESSIKQFPSYKSIMIRTSGKRYDPRYTTPVVK